MDKVNEEIKSYIENNIFPKYDKYFAHGMMHINAVIENMMMLADYYHLDKIWHLLLVVIMMLV